eukprot:EG_transcript_15019
MPPLPALWGWGLPPGPALPLLAVLLFADGLAAHQLPAGLSRGVQGPGPAQGEWRTHTKTGPGRVLATRWTQPVGRGLGSRPGPRPESQGALSPASSTAAAVARGLGLGLAGLLLAWLGGWRRRPPRAVRPSGWALCTASAVPLPGDQAGLTLGFGAGFPDDAACPLVDRLAEVIRQCWQEIPGVVPVTVDPALAEIHGAYEESPMTIRNTVLSAPGFRKMHLEVAAVRPGLEILHCVMFPDPRFDLPLFGCDIVVARGQVTAAIVDVSPLADCQAETLALLLARRPTHGYASPRSIPDWGLSIFSPFVRFVRLESPEEQRWFLDDVRYYLEVVASLAATAVPEPADAATTAARRASQVEYCRQQRKNDKTRRILAKAFGDAWADHYMAAVLFDCP